MKICLICDTLTFHYNIYFYKKRKCVKTRCYFMDKWKCVDRLLFISGLKYVLDMSGCYDIKLYNIKEFKRYIDVLKAVYPERKYVYDQKEVESLFNEL